MDRLHRGDHAVLAEPGEVGGIDVLGMLDPPAPITLVGAGQLADRVERHGVGGIADGVDRDLEGIDRGAAHQVAQLGVVELRQTLVARRVGVGRT